MNYEELLIKSEADGLIVKEMHLMGNDGRIRGRRIAIRQDIATTAEKACVLAEELGHHHTTYGDILDITNVQNRKQELKARLFAYQKLVTPEKLIASKNAGCRNSFEIAEYLNVTEAFLLSAIDTYRHIYGCAEQFGNYLLVFEPCLNIHLIN